MASSPASEIFPVPTLVTLGDSSVLVRFGGALTDSANRAAIALALALQTDPVPGVTEVAPNLVSVLLRYDPMQSSPSAIAGELRLRLAVLGYALPTPRQWKISVTFDGPNLDEVSNLLGLSRVEFIAAHNRRPLRVLATGFAPGFVYCGLHEDDLLLPRRTEVRSSVPAGSVLFAAGQTAITATEMPTGWHMIGRTGFVNFAPESDPPTRLAAGDVIAFEAEA